MDPVQEIKARLPIEELVRQYAELQKKGRNFVALCPFHHDTKPSLLVSPDKGIAYCFPCQKGGDVFSFYQLIEGVDFPQAIKELAEKTGVRIETRAHATHVDEKERLRACLEAAVSFYRDRLRGSASALEYLNERGVTEEEAKTFELGLAPDGSGILYDHLLKAGFSRKEIVGAGLAIQRELQESQCFDRFRGRLMFPIRDGQERMIGFGGRTLIQEDAKYMNSSDGPLYRKSGVLYGLPYAREAMRSARTAILVEGYFDVLACHRVGVHHVVATCGTALTEEHARLLKRSVDTVVLCLDSDRAGKAAAERAFSILMREELKVHLLHLPSKDPADAVLEHPDILAQLLRDGGVPYIDAVLEEIRSANLHTPAGKREALDRLSGLYEGLPTAVQRMAFLEQASPVLGVAATQLERDLAQLSSAVARTVTEQPERPGEIFSPVDIALGLFLLYPRSRGLLQELIPPHDPRTMALYEALRTVPEGSDDPLTALELSSEDKERALVLQLFCEEHGFGQWSESLAAREIRRNCTNANRETLRRKQVEITERLLLAKREGKVAEEELLKTQYQQLLKLAKMAM